MRFPIINFELTPENVEIEMAKMEEEVAEVRECINDNHSDEHLLEECFDVIEVTLNMLCMMYPLERLEEAAKAHCKKLVERGHDFKYVLELKKVEEADGR